MRGKNVVKIRNGWMKRCTMVGRTRRAILRPKCKRGPEENDRGCGGWGKQMRVKEEEKEERREHND